MIVSVNQPQTGERKVTSPKIKRYTGEVVYIYAFDVAYDMTRRPVPELLGQPVAQFVVDASKRSLVISFSSVRRWCGYHL